MQCPICNIELKMAERQGIEIDYCPQCRGIWLDRGELDKIIERSTSSSRSEPARERSPRPLPDEHARDRDYERRGDEEYYKKRKRKSFLGDLFDFD